VTEPGRPSRTARADAQRERVLAAAVEIFSRQGFRATSMNEIAAQVGLSKPTLYHYFRNKEELLVRIYSDVLDDNVRAARQIVSAAPTPLDALRDLLVHRVVYTAEHRELLKVCFEEEDELPAELAASLLDRRRAFESVVREALAAHLAAHPEASPGMAPTTYVNMCLGAVNWTYKWFDPNGRQTARELADEMATALTALLTVPKPESVATGRN
jgi:TetR/AcrR family transcriptional regulator, cholesterol catabolism regulator